MDKHSRLRSVRNADLDLFHVRGCFGGKGSAPPAPDYVGAAQAQGAANREAALVSGRLANPNVTNPYGSRTVTFGGTADEPTVSVIDTLSPTGQRLFEQQNRISQGVGDLAEASVGRVGSAMAAPLDTANFPGQKRIAYDGPQVTGTIDVNGPDLARAIASAGPIQRRVGANDFSADRDLVTRSIIDRNQPFIDRSRDRLDNQLRNQGVMPGTEAYRAAMDDFTRQQNDFNLGAIAQGGQEQSRLFGLDLSAGQFANQAQQQQYSQNANNAQFQNTARQQAFGEGLSRAQLQNAAAAQGFNQAQAAAQFENAARAQMLQEALLYRQLPLNEVNALRTGAQITAPQFQAYQGQQVGAAPIFGATQAQYQGDINAYNAQQAGNNSFMGGLFGLGSAALIGNPFGIFGQRH